MGRDLREFRRREKRTLGQDHGAVDRVLELPQVAGPVVAGEQACGLRGQAPDPLALVGRETADEAMRPIGDGLPLRPQGAHGYRQGLEGVEEILAKMAGPHRSGDVQTRSNDPDVVAARRACAVLPVQEG